MKKNILSFIIVLCTQFFFSQVGLGTPTPRGALDINKPTTNNMGLVLPTNSSVSNIINPMGGNLVPGTFIYDSTKDCVRIYKGTNSWSDCFCECSSFALDCTGATHNGILTSGSSASGASSVISYTGGNGGAYAAQSVTSTGVTGLTATLNAGNFANGNGSLTYTITGTPSAAGTASFAINIGGQSCTFTRTVDNAGPSTPDLTANCTGFYLPYTTNGGTANGTVNGLPVTATFSAYTNVSSSSTQSLCGITVNGSAFFLSPTGVNGSMKINFNRKVSNFKVFQGASGAGERYTYTLKKDGVVVSSTISISPVGTCNSNFTITGNVVDCSDVNNKSSIIYNIGGVWFDEIVIDYRGAAGGSILNFCVGSAL